MTQRNGTRVAVTSFSESKVMLLDASDPLNPTQLSEVAFGDGAVGPGLGGQGLR